MCHMTYFLRKFEFSYTVCFTKQVSSFNRKDLVILSNLFSSVSQLSTQQFDIMSALFKVGKQIARQGLAWHSRCHLPMTRSTILFQKHTFTTHGTVPVIQEVQCYFFSFSNKRKYNNHKNNLNFFLSCMVENSNHICICHFFLVFFFCCLFLMLWC